MAVQINARLPDDIARKLDRIAAERGLARPELVRQLVEELVEAEAQGRELFAKPEQPSAGDLQRLVGRLQRHDTELDRVLRQHAKREGELARQAREDTLGVSAARQGIADDVAARNIALVAQLRADLVTAGEGIAAQVKQDPQLGEIARELGEIGQYVREPRRQFNLVLGDDRFWSTAFIAGWSGVMLLFGLALATPLFATLPGFGVPVASKLLDGDDDVCRLLERRYAQNDCTVPENRRVKLATARRR